MRDERRTVDDGGILDPEDVNSGPISAAAGGDDPAADIPVPAAMNPAEVDERARAVEAVRRGGGGDRGGDRGRDRGRDRDEGMR